MCFFLKLSRYSNSRCDGLVGNKTSNMDLKHVKIRNMDDLFALSIQSHQQLKAKIKDADKMSNYIRNKYKLYFESVWMDCPLQLQIILNSLNEDQKKVYFGIFNNLRREGGSVSTLDAGPGTGKTFLTACILLVYKKSATYMVYTNRLSESMNELFFTGQSLTCCKFLMNFLDLSYAKVKYMWYLKGKELHEKCEEIQEIAKGHKPFHSFYIVDENSVVSPFFIYFMTCLREYHGIHLMFIGDRYQQIPINATKYHMEPNYSLLNLVSDTVFNLTVNIRQDQDPTFVNLLKDFTQKFQDNNKHMNFAIKYFFYNALRSKFHAKEDFEATFFAQHHVVLKERIDRYEKKLQDNKSDYIRSFLYVRSGKRRTELEPMMEIEEITKFKPYIILVKNEEYTYAPNSTTCMTVKLIDIGSVYLKVYCQELQRHIKIKKIPLNIYFSSEQLIAKINELGYTCAYQFPLKEKISTYHAAQGLTIASKKIELDSDCRSINSFYVGLTRIKNLDQLTKIHSKELLSLAYTHFRNDDYYYKVVVHERAKVDPKSFVTCNNINMFENAKQNLRIPKRNYSMEVSKNRSTALMEHIRTIKRK